MSTVPQIKIYPDKFRDQLVIVTGAAQGIGEITSRLFASQGATVVLVDVQKEKLESVVKDIKSSGQGDATYRVANVADDTEVNALIDDVIKTYGYIDVMVHLAGIYPTVPIVQIATELYRQVMGVNMDGCFFLTRAVLPHMNKRGYGRIICTSSGTLQLPPPGQAVYVAAKAAIAGFMRATAIECGAGVTANTILPGLIATEAVKAKYLLPDGTRPFLDELIQKQAVKRSGRPEDIAYTICFMASPETAFTTGQIYDVGGGATFH
jgi:NAD(P)-dependent dehydrogenase (short-subunit alcohol dehydrogenase family)